MTTARTLRNLAALLGVLLFAAAASALSISSFSPTDTTPTLNISQTSSFNITVDDPTNVTYAWRVDGTLLQNTSTSLFLYTPSSTGQKTITVNATRNGTSESVTRSWTPTVLDPSKSAGITSKNILLLGDDQQKVSNRDSEEVSARDLFIEGSMSVTNNEATTLSDLTATSDPASGFSIGDLNITISLDKTSLAPGESATATVRSRLPDQLDAVNRTTFLEMAPKVATLSYTAKASNGTQFSTSTSLNIQRKNQLIIKDINVCIETDCSDASEGGTIDNVQPGDSVEIEVEVENLYSTRKEEDLDIEDVEINYDIDDNDFSEDDSDDIGDVGPRETESTVFSLDVPDDLDSGVYDVQVDALGRDSNGAYHGDMVGFKISVDRKSHDVQIRNFVLNPSVLICGQRSFTATVGTQNLGRSDEKESKIIVSNSELGIRREVGPFLIEKNDRHTDALSLTVPDGIGAGDYIIVAKSYFDTDKQTDEEGRTLTIQDCVDEQKGTSDEGQDQGTQSSDSSSSSNTSSTGTGSTPTRSTARNDERVYAAPTTAVEQAPSSSSTGSGPSVGLLIALGVFIGLGLVGILALLLLRR